MTLLLANQIADIFRANDIADIFRANDNHSYYYCTQHNVLID